MSQIDDGFKKMLDGIRQTDEGRDAIMRGLEQAWEGRTDLDRRLHDMEETITQLQALVLSVNVAGAALLENLEGRRDRRAARTESAASRAAS